MGKRIVRIPATSEALSGLKGIHLNLVLRNGVTYFGRFISEENQVITLEDGLQRERRYPLQQIEEIVYDINAAF
ncbi:MULTISPECIES: hypothetical protein [unclassified Siphonobacter]|uniref:hypothetical protein n=1 Tax=unclassified Siphonobacter TaxID=2635712 RepID=UPI000CBB0098|nr:MULTISPECIES: hypothetical protein [unclassified Siphonobacter]MDQ1086825.1 hypothetical protein [Siphonobacter sp. SORGH_AS_1065]MDR6197075.1 hypothetical protein [Siphonobacter sp. SORGH_AS_0500]PKK36315.1 hypothetical protein BWI96_13075 [Siphonobacter sp. SORGH_AS_0500]